MDSELATPSTTSEPELTGPGVRLKMAREAAGMSAEELARRLHLKIDLITALESNDFARLPEPTYVRGYLRAAAKALAIDETPLMEAYAALSLPEPKMEAPQRLQEPYLETKGRKPVYIAAIVLLAVIVGLFAYRFVTEPPQDASVEAITVDPAAPMPTPEPVTVPDSEPPTPPTDADGEVSGDVPGAPPIIEAIPDQTPVTATAAVPPPTSARSPVATSGESHVQITVRRDSWIEIRDADDRRLVSDLLRAGTERVIEGKSPMRVVIGNAEGVTLSFNGRPVDIAPHVGRDRVARLTLPLP